MIEQLMVKDYILFDHAYVDFKKNMSVITGETGAGKSLLIDALTYLSGARITGNIVRKGKEKATLQLTLSIEDSPQAKELLEENGFDAEDELIITRIVSDKGKSKIRINQQPTSLAFVKKLMSLLIDVHSQTDTLQLMDPAVQLSLLDQYAKTQDLRAQTAQAYSELHKIQLEIKKAKSETFSDDELDFVTSQLNEIDEANIQPDELDELQKKIKTASSLQKNLEDYSECIYNLKKENGILDLLFDTYKTANKNNLMEESAEQLHQSYYSLQALCEELESAKDSLIYESDDLDTMQERVYTIKKIYRKYGGSYEGIMDKKKSLEEKIDRIIHRQDYFDKLEKEEAALMKTYLEQAQKLSSARKAVFEELQNKIEEHAHDLMLEHAQFVIDRKEKALSADGIDDISFLVSMNPGQPLTSLKQSASGGELARLMLALKVVFQTTQGIDTIVFDEIDTGVSGKVAYAMGSKMHALAKNYQVLCITHLPSVAVWADTHFRVSKSSSEDSTLTQVEELNDKEELEELAIMANGTITPAGIESMAQLKEQVKHG